jgi:hypothetical protein
MVLLWHTVNMEYGVQHKLFIHTVNKFTVVPEAIYSLLPLVGKVVNTIRII